MDHFLDYLAIHDFVAMANEAEFITARCSTSDVRQIPCPTGTKDGAEVMAFPFSGGCNPGWLSSSEAIAERLRPIIERLGLLSVYRPGSKPQYEGTKFVVVLKELSGTSTVSLSIDDSGHLVAVNTCPTVWPPQQADVEFLLPAP